MKQPTRRRLALVAAFVLLLGQIPACQPEPQEELRGSLYFASGQYLAQLDLRDGSTSIVTNLGDVEIRAISPQRDSRLLLTVTGSTNQRDTQELVLYDIATRQALTLLNGRHGHYLPDSDVLVYDDGTRIYVAERSDGEWEKTLVQEHAYKAALTIAPISATRFLFAVAGGPVNLFDLESKRSVELPALGSQCRLDASLWSQQREQLLCRVRRDDGSQTYVFATLEGVVQSTLALPAARSLQPVAFLPDQDAVVFTERWRSAISGRERHAVWIYRFDSGALYRLIDNQHLGRTVVYAR